MDLEFPRSVAYNRFHSRPHLIICFNNDASILHLSSTSLHRQSSRSVFLPLCRLLHACLSRHLLHQFVHGTNSVLSSMRYTDHLSPEDRLSMFRRWSDASQSAGGLCLHYSLYEAGGSRGQSSQYMWWLIDLFGLRSGEILRTTWAFVRL